MSFDIFWHKTMRRPYRLHVSDTGGKKPVLVLLHGIAASGEDWRPLITLLKPTYRCITIDLIGFGQSPKPTWYSYTMDEHIRCLRSTLRSLHLPQFTLVGHSLGSLLATDYASKYGTSIKHLVLLSPPIYPPLASTMSRSARYQTNLFMHIYQLLRSDTMTPEKFRRLSRILPLPKGVVENPDIWIPFRRTLEKCIETQTIAQDIQDISVPIDIFYGTFDQVVIADNVERLAKLKGVETHTLNVNHRLGKRYASAVASLLQSS